MVLLSEDTIRLSFRGGEADLSASVSWRTRASSSGVIIVISDRVLPLSGEDIREKFTGERGEEVTGLDVASESDSLGVSKINFVFDSESLFCFSAFEFGSTCT